MTDAKPPKTRPAKFICNLPAGRMRSLAVGRHNADELFRLLGIKVKPYEIRDCGNGQRLVFCPGFVWNKSYTKLKKAVWWYPAFGYTPSSLNPDRLP